ncbi:MAG: hypothetical protein ABSH35_10630 [Isosphaeraceae bacterium]|jgi:hypothetical protein
MKPRKPAAARVLYEDASAAAIRSLRGHPPRVRSQSLDCCSRAFCRVLAGSSGKTGNDTGTRMIPTNDKAFACNP